MDTRYKVPDGKPLNKFALDERCMGRSYAMKVCYLSLFQLLKLSYRISSRNPYFIELNT